MTKIRNSRKMPKQALSLWFVTMTIERPAQTMKQMNLSGDNFYYIRGAEFDYYRKFIDGYNEAVGRMLEAGMNAILTARAGGDAAPHLKQLDGIPAEYGVVMDRLSLLRIKLPDRWVILEAAEAILENSAAELVVQQRASEARIRGQEEKFNNPGNAFAGNGPASAPSNRAAEEQASFRHTIDVIMNSEGTGTVSQRIAGYLKAYGGDLVSSVDVIAKAGKVDAGTVGGVEIAGLHEAAADEVNKLLVADTNFQWVPNAYDQLAEEAIGTAEDKALYQTVHQQFADLLTLVQHGFDEVIAEYQSQIDTKSQRLLTDKNLGAVDKTLLTTEIAAAGLLKASLIVTKSVTPSTPGEAGLMAALSPLGLAALKRAPLALRTAIIKFDEIADTKLAAKLIPELAPITANIGKLLAKVQSRIAAAGELIELEFPFGHAILKHVGLSAEQLLARLASEPTISAATSFLNMAKAREIITRTLSASKTEIDLWLQSAKPGQIKDLFYNGSEIIGNGIARGEDTAQYLYNALVRIVADGKGGYVLKTSYPIHPL